MCLTFDSKMLDLVHESFNSTLEHRIEAKILWRQGRHVKKIG